MCILETFVLLRRTELDEQRHELGIEKSNMTFRFWFLNLLMLMYFIHIKFLDIKSIPMALLLGTNLIM